MKKQIQDIYRKNKDDLKALLFGGYPDFVYKSVETIPPNVIPIFTFHSVESKLFEAQIRYLADNGYTTVTADGYYDILCCKVPHRPKTVVLTFDDGRASLWSVAYPILKKYGLTAISFIVPMCIKEVTEYYPNLEDVWKGATSIVEVENREQKELLCSWKEIIDMHQSGVIDFQSHSSFHHSVFTTDDLVDFINPTFRPKMMCGTLHPVIRKYGVDTVPHDLDLGHPIYNWASSLSSSRRYMEDEGLSLACLDFVKDHGGGEFFHNRKWRKTLNQFTTEYCRKNGKNGRFQTLEERVSDMRHDLLQSKTVIEEKLNKQVLHFCFPWYAGSEVAVTASQDVGYVSNYWGILQNRAVNRIGDNPYYVARMNDEYIFSLPGRGRMALFSLLFKKYLRVTNRKIKARKAEADAMSSKQIHGHS